METNATLHAAELGVEHFVSIIGPVQNAAEAAAAREVSIGSLVKTIVVRTGEAAYILLLVPGDRLIDWPKLRTHLGVSRLSMPSADEAFEATGYVRGTITPFGAKNDWPVIADQRLVGQSELAIGGGAPGVGIHVGGGDLIRVLGADVADITKFGDS